MTTTQIATYADPESLAAPDINLQVELRRNVIPAFYHDVSEVGWRRINTSEVVAAGERSFTLPVDFSEMKKVIPSSSSDFNSAVGLPYIGDNVDLVSQAEASTTASAPTAYYIDWSTSPYPTLKFSGPLDQQYTFRYSYLSMLQFIDDTSVMQLDAFIPRDFQWALVQGLRRVIYARRFGVGDNRYQEADTEYKRFVMAARKNRERTGQERPRFVN